MAGEVFGHEFKERYFTLLDPSVIPLNHGHFGITPTCVIKKQVEISYRRACYPDYFETIEAERLYMDQIQQLSDYLNLDAKNLVLVANTTTAVNTVIRSIPWNFSKDKVLFHSTSFKACQNTIRFMADYFSLQYDVVQLNYPLEVSEVLARFEEKLSTGDYRLCMFDMITSTPSAKLPYEELIKMCKKYDTMSLLDGAHASGMIDLYFLDELKPDFMATNLHKWFYVPKSCGMLYVNETHHSMIQSFPVCQNYSETCHFIQERERNDSLLHKKFNFLKTIGCHQFFCIEEAIRFRKEICGGEDRIRDYQSVLRERAIEVVIEIFGPGSVLLQSKERSFLTPGLFNVTLPLDDKYQSLQEKLRNDPNYFTRFKSMCDRCTIKRKAHVPFFYHNGRLYVRFSVQIVNEIQDYVVGARIFKNTFIELLDRELKEEA